MLCLASTFSSLASFLILCASFPVPCYLSLKVINGNLSHFENRDIIQATEPKTPPPTETAELIESGRVKVSGSSRPEQQRMWLRALNAAALRAIGLWKLVLRAKREQNTRGTHHSGPLMTCACSWVFVVGISWRSEVRVVRICSKIRERHWEQIHFYAPLQGQ